MAARDASSARGEPAARRRPAYLGHPGRSEFAADHAMCDTARPSSSVVNP